jgi:hypothetical protein
MSPNGRPGGARARLSLVLAAALVVAACGTISTTPPAPTPADFTGIAGFLANAGVTVTNVVSGDAGCADPDITKTAIGFDARGADQATPVRIHFYIFRNHDTYVRERASVDRCAASFVTDPSTYESEEASPFVIAGQGPWAPTFRERLRSALVKAAGDGG